MTNEYILWDRIDAYRVVSDQLQSVKQRISYRKLRLISDLDRFDFDDTV